MKKKKSFFIFMVLLICCCISFLFFQNFNHHVLTDEEKKAHITFLDGKFNLLDRYVEDQEAYPDFYAVSPKNSLDEWVLISYTDETCLTYEVGAVRYGVSEISIALNPHESLSTCSTEKKSDYVVLQITNPFHIPYVVSVEKNAAKTNIDSFDDVYLHVVNTYVNNEKK